MISMLTIDFVLSLSSQGVVVMHFRGVNRTLDLLQLKLTFHR